MNNRLEDNFTTRVVRVVKNLSILKDSGLEITDKVTSDSITLAIHIRNTLPICIINSDLVTTQTLDTTETPVATDLTLVKNVIADPLYKNSQGNYEDRFVYITTSKSAYSLRTVQLYYDKKYKDIIIVPETAYLPPKEITRNKVINVVGLRVGSGKRLDEVQLENSLGTLESDKVELPVTNENIACKTITADLHGIEHGSRNVETIYFEYNKEHNGRTVNYGVARNRTDPVTLIEIGTAAQVFSGFTNGYLPTFTVYQQKVDEFSVMYMGEVNPRDNKLYLSLQF